jgi:hypothetical protein
MSQCYKIEFVSRWRLLNYDPNFLKVAKLVSEAVERLGPDIYDILVNTLQK